LLRNRKTFSVFIVVLAVLVASISVYCYYVSLPPPVVEEGKPHIVGHVSHIEESGKVRFLVVEGVVQNDMSVNARVNVSVSFYDAESNWLGEQSHGTDLEILKPGQRSPFKFHWAFSSLEEVTYQLRLLYVGTSDQPVDVLEPVDLTNQTLDGQFIVSGNIWNRRVFKALNIGVACAYYDAGGNFSGVARTFVRSVDAGGKTAFNVTIDVDVSGSPSSYELMVYAAGYEELSIPNYVLFTLLIVAILAVVLFLKRRGW